MTKLKTLYSSNIPVDCHILKGRLETEGIKCFIYDEQMVSVHPFRAVAIGGVKLKVPVDKFDQSRIILDMIEHGILIDEEGEYPISEIYDNEIKRQNDILIIKNKIRIDPTLLDKEIENKNDQIDHFEIEEIKKQESKFLKYSKIRFQFSWRQFFYELFDFDRSVFKYFRTKPVDYYIDKEIVDNYINQSDSQDICNCPNCNSDNVSLGYAIDYKWDFIFLIVSLLLTVPFFLIRKKYHCFECGHNFRQQKTAAANRVDG
jgi:hypothetical protein